MSRRLLVWLLVAFAAHLVADDLKKDRSQPPPPSKEEPLQEEDETLAPADEQFSFNPLQAEKDLSVGNYYFKKGKYHAAANRFRRATKWNDGFAEAWLRLGEAEEKQKDGAAAKEAYTKYLALAPDAKNASDIRKKIGKLR